MDGKMSIFTRVQCRWHVACVAICFIAMLAMLLGLVILLHPQIFCFLCTKQILSIFQFWISLPWFIPYFRVGMKVWKLHNLRRFWRCFYPAKGFLGTWPTTLPRFLWTLQMDQIHFLSHHFVSKEISQNLLNIISKFRYICCIVALQVVVMNETIWSSVIVYHDIHIVQSFKALVVFLQEASGGKFLPSFQP